VKTARSAYLPLRAVSYVEYGFIPTAFLLIQTSWYILLIDIYWCAGKLDNRRSGEKSMDTAKVFQSGRSQAVRLPKEYRFDGKQVFIKKVGDAVVLMPYQGGWQTLFDSLGQFSEDFMVSRDQPEQQVREDAFA
jgi:antitoxin VapB